ncbi:hypothetical protein K3495_g10026 [Podosphaera aphanis]|nr:hypothetical protein K3495_g10026 [Podosphaera aphanis]
MRFIGTYIRVITTILLSSLPVAKALHNTPLTLAGGVRCIDESSVYGHTLYLPEYRLVEARDEGCRRHQLKASPGIFNYFQKRPTDFKDPEYADVGWPLIIWPIKHKREISRKFYIVLRWDKADQRVCEAIDVVELVESGDGPDAKFALLGECFGARTNHNSKAEYRSCTVRK